LERAEEEDEDNIAEKRKRQKESEKGIVNDIIRTRYGIEDIV